MFDRRTIIALVLVVIVISLLPTWQRLVNPHPPVMPVDTTHVRTPVDTTAAKAPVKAPETTAAAIPPPQPKGEPGVISPDTTQPVPEYVRVETPLFAMALGSNAEVTRYNLKQYHLQNGEPVALHEAATASGPEMGYVDFDFGSYNPHTIKNLRFVADKTQITVRDGISDSVTFVAGDSAGQQIRLTYIFTGDRYAFGLALHTEKLPPPESDEFHATWKGGLPLTEPDTARDIQYSAAYAKVGDDVVKTAVGRDLKKEFSASGQTGFVAVHSKYFIAALIPDQPAAGTDIVGRNPTGGKAVQPYYDASLREPWGHDAAGRWTVYWGPIRVDNLKALNVGLEETMYWGWAIVKPFSRLVLWALTGLHSVIPNYGVVIVLFAILIKMLLWPLTRKSQISMKKMSALQPEIQALKELHKNNPQAMNAATMKLYKDSGVNPASGCLLLLPQMPVLYALYAIFSSTIEFRQAPFFAWITDLSRPDIVATLPFNIPLYGSHVAILPLIMGVTQFLMAKRTTTDPNQKMMVYFMPIFMTLIFNNFPSGLTLYYTLFNLLALAEQHFIKTPNFTPSVSVVEEPKRKTKR